MSPKWFCECVITAAALVLIGSLIAAVWRLDVDWDTGLLVIPYPIGEWFWTAVIVGLAALFGWQMEDTAR